MRKIIGLLMLWMMALCGFAQDIIVTKDAKKIDGKVTEVGVENIRYKPKSTPSVEYVISKKDVNSIVFSHGHVEVFSENASSTSEKEEEKRMDEVDVATSHSGVGGDNAKEDRADSLY